MKFTHTIFYVKDIARTLKFYEEAFGLKPKFVHESGAYAELDTEGPTLAFADEELAHMNIPGGFQNNSPKSPPQACEIVFSTDDVQEGYETVLKAGADAVAPPTEKPWGQIVAYARDPSGIMLEIAQKMIS